MLNQVILTGNLGADPEVFYASVVCLWLLLI